MEGEGEAVAVVEVSHDQLEGIEEGCGMVDCGEGKVVNRVLETESDIHTLMMESGKNEVENKEDLADMSFAA